MEKCGVLHFGSNNLRNGASCALDKYGTLIGICMWIIDWQWWFYSTSTLRGDSGWQGSPKGAGHWKNLSVICTNMQFFSHKTNIGL